MGGKDGHQLDTVTASWPLETSTFQSKRSKCLQITLEQTYRHTPSLCCVIWRSEVGLQETNDGHVMRDGTTCTGQDCFRALDMHA